MYDGEIRIRSRLDNSDFEKKADQIEQKLGSIKQAAEQEIKIGNNIKISPEVSKQLDAVIAKMEERQKKLQESGSAVIDAPRVAPIDWDKHVTDAARAQAEIDKIYQDSKRDPQTDNYFASEISKRKAALQALKNSGKDFGDEDYDQAYAALKKMEDQLSQYKKTVAETAGLQSELKQRIIEARDALAGLENEGYHFGDRDYDQAYIALQNALEAQKKYKAELNQQTDAEIAKAAEKTAQEEKLAQIKQNAVISDERLVALLEEQATLQKRIKELKAAGVTAGYEEYDSASSRLGQIQSELNKGNRSIRPSDAFKRMEQSAKKVFASISSGARKAFGTVGKSAKKAFGKVNSSANKSAGFLEKFWRRVVRLAKQVFVFTLIRRTFTSMVRGFKQGFQNLAAYSRDFNAVLSNFKSATATLKNSLASAFSPIASIIIPYLTKLINVLNIAASKIAQFFAVLTGKSTYAHAIQQQVDFTESLDGTAEAAKKAAGALAGFDKLNVINQDNGADGGGGGASGGGEMFEELPVEGQIKDFAEKVKDILSKLFAPLKEAWNREGEFVMKSWKFALDEIKQLAKDIGRDFLEVWNQERTIQMFANILHIIGSIGLVIGNIAHGLDEAWNANETGLKILQNIRDIFAVIINNIRRAVSHTVRWSKNLDFSPLLEAFERYTASLVPVAQNLSGILTDFYEDVLLPIAKWTIEKGLPEFLDILTAFNEAVDWEGLRDRLKTFWEHLEPFMETVGEGLLIFIGDLSQKIAEFTKSETFEKLLSWLEEKMDGATPQDIADGLKKIATAFIGFKIAGIGLKALSTLAPAVITIKSLVGLFTAGKGAAVAGQVTTASTAFSGLATALGSLVTGAGATLLFFDSLKKLKEDRKFFGVFEDVPVQEDFDTFADYQTALNEHKEKMEDMCSEKFKMPGIEYDENGWNTKLKEIRDKANIALLGESGSFFNAPIWDWDLEGFWSATVAPWLEEKKKNLSDWWIGVDEYWSEHAPLAWLPEWFNTSVKPWFTKSKWDELHAGVKEAFDQKWTEIKQGLVQKYDEIKKKTDELKDKFSEFKKKVKENFEEIGKKIKTGLEPAVDILGKFKDKLTEVIDAVKDFLKSGWNKAVEIGKGIGNAITGKGKAAPASYSLESNPLSDIPQLANGAVIRGGNPFLAILGDQPMGRTNIEAPISTIEQALRNVLKDNRGGGDIHLTVNLEGRQIHKEVVRQDQIFRKSTGRSGFVY